MAVIFKGSIPTCCGYCCECLGGGSDAYYCNRIKRHISDVIPPYDKRMDWCPIVGEIDDDADIKYLNNIINMRKQAKRLLNKKPINHGDSMPVYLEE